MILNTLQHKLTIVNDV